MKYLTIAICACLVPSSSTLLRAEERPEQPSSNTVTSGPVTVTASIDKANGSVAEPLHLTLHVEAPRGAHIEWPALGKQLGDLELSHFAKTNDVPSASSPDRREWTLEATLESIKTGDLTIPPLDFHYALDSTSDIQTVQSAPVHVHIASVLEDRADPKKFRDIKQTVDVPVAPEASSKWLVWTGGAVACVALALVAVAVKRRKRGPAPVQWALESIAELDQRKSAGADANSLFNEIVAIVRRFVELEFGVATVSRTTNEFLSEAVTELDLPPQPTERLKWLAAVADEIKFARLTIGAQHLDQAFSQAKALIHECDEHQRALAKGGS